MPQDHMWQISTLTVSTPIYSKVIPVSKLAVLPTTPKLLVNYIGNSSSYSAPRFGSTELSDCLSTLLICLELQEESYALLSRGLMYASEPICQE